MTRALALAVVLGLAGCHGAREVASSAPAARVEVGPVAPFTARPGDRRDVRVPVRVADGFHVQANPAANEFLIAMDLNLPGADGVVVGPPTYPPGTPLRLAGSDDDLSVYEGTIAVDVALGIAPDAAPGPRTLSGSVRVQACDDARCFAPETLPFEVALDVVP